jgi:hypothetical protein
MVEQAAACGRQGAQSHQACLALRALGGLELLAVNSFITACVAGGGCLAGRLALAGVTSAVNLRYEIAATPFRYPVFLWVQFFNTHSQLHARTHQRLQQGRSPSRVGQSLYN